MQQKEVLIVVGVLVVGFLLLQKGNLFSGRATYADASNYITEPDPYGGGAGLGMGATGDCPPPILRDKRCSERTSGPPSPPTNCNNCLNRACIDLSTQCNHYCGLDQPGAPKCWPQIDCRTYGCYLFYEQDNDIIRDAWIGNAVAMCSCEPIETTA